MLFYTSYDMTTAPPKKMLKRRRTSKLLIKRKGGANRQVKYVLDAVRNERVDNDGVSEYMVSWKGYSRQHDSWIRVLPSLFARQWIIEKEFGVTWGIGTWNYSTSNCGGPDVEYSDMDVLANMACQQLQ
jgi:hypothetical protein